MKYISFPLALGVITIALSIVNIINCRKPIKYLNDKRRNF